MTMLEGLGWLLLALIVIGATAYGISNALSKSKLATLEQNLIVLRMQTQQLFSGSGDYSGLDNSLAIRSGIAPKPFIKGNTLVNGWNGNITLAPEDGESGFSITIGGIPQAECTQLARFQMEEWISVSVNGSETASVAEAAGACSGNNNSIVYVAR